MPEDATHLRNEGSRRQVVAAGAVAGLVSRFFIAPLDVVKIRLQLQVYSPTSPVPSRGSTAGISQGTLNVIKGIFKDEGVRAFWKGNVSAELLYVTYGASQFSTYRLATQVLESLPVPSTVHPFIAGALAGATATTVTYPLDLLRTRFAAQATDKIYESLRAGVRDIAHQEGPFGFFRGLSPAVVQIVPYMGLFFSVYEVFRPLIRLASLPFGSADATAGMIAGLLAKTGVFPLDLIRKRLQVQGPMRMRYAGGTIPLYDKGMWMAGKSIVFKEGWRGLYRGLGISLVKSAPASAITMWTYGRALKIMREVEIPNG